MCVQVTARRGSILSQDKSQIHFSSPGSKHADCHHVNKTKQKKSKEKGHCEKHMIGLASTASSTTCFPHDTGQVMTSSHDI